MTGSDLKDQLVVQALCYDAAANAYSWAQEAHCWGQVEADTRNNLFSSVGIGARGAVVHMRRGPRLTLDKSLLWRGRHCFLTAITDADPGFSEIRAALVEVAACQADLDKGEDGCRFPGVLTEKYIRHEQPDLHSEVSGDFVLVTPKVVALRPGSWVTVNGDYYRVLVPHELDPHKNEYEIQRREDC